MEYEIGVRLDRIEQALAYIVKELEEAKQNNGGKQNGKNESKRTHEKS